MSGWLNGKSMPRQDKLRSLAELLDVDLHYLQTGEGKPRLLREGRAVALASDAGTPAVSDPGALLVDRVRSEGFPVFAIATGSKVSEGVSARGSAGTMTDFVEPS